MQDASRLAAAQHLDFDPGTHTHRHQALMQHRMGRQALHTYPFALRNTAQWHHDPRM